MLLVAIFFDDALLSLADPFNRAPLNIGMVEPVPELRERWVWYFNLYCYVSAFLFFVPCCRIQAWLDAKIAEQQSS